MSTAGPMCQHGELLARRSGRWEHLSDNQPCEPACAASAPEQDALAAEPSPLGPGATEGVEYHWMLTYVVPILGGAHIRQKSGVITLTDETHSQAFAKLCARIVEEDGITASDFSVMSFTLEPNQLQAAFLPRRGDAVETWLLAVRDTAHRVWAGNPGAYQLARLHGADETLAAYRAYCDADVPLGEPLISAADEEGMAAQAAEPASDRGDFE